AATSVVIAFGRAGAGVQLSNHKLQVAVTPRRLSLSAANALYPLGLGLQLQGFGFDVREWHSTTTVLLDDIGYLDRIEELLRSLSVNDLKTIIEYKVLDFNAPFLSTPFVKARSDFYDMVIGGLKEPPSRATICRGQVETSMGELLGSYYLKEVWTADTAARADSLVLSLEAAFKTGLDSAGSPTSWGGPTLTFDPKAYIANLNKVSEFDTAFNLAKIGTAVDKQIWWYTAQTVNAYHDRPANAIVFPAATLQPPLYDAKADLSVNYGATGTLVGHEITHGFDNDGRDFDGDGNLNPWWTAAATKMFDEKAKCFIEQYGSMDVKSEFTGDLLGKLDGKLTLVETIADNGGLNTAYRAYRDYVNAVAEATKYTKEAGEKMFWIRYGQSWCEKNSDEYLQILLADEHPPGRYRLIGAVKTTIGDLLSSYYLKKVWTADTAARDDSLVLMLKAAYKTGLDSAGCLDDTTPANAKTKFSKPTHLLGGHTKIE
ncbi:hypothetical protein DYB38_014085, partial [Aphanomyces astaci]